MQRRQGSLAALWLGDENAKKPGDTAAGHVATAPTVPGPTTAQPREVPGVDFNLSNSEKAGKPGAVIGNGDVRFSRSAMKSAEANIARGRAAMHRALLEKADQHRAMHRTGLGWVDFVWGNEGVVKASGNTKGAMGLAHILEARQRKDGMSAAQAQDFLGEVVTAIASGSEVSRREVGTSVRVGVEHGSTLVWLTRRAGANAWVVTRYEKDPSGTAAGRATAVPTHSAASLTRDKMEGSGSILDDSGRDDNVRFSRTQMANIKASALEQLHTTLSHPGRVSLWDKTVGTMRHLGGRSPAFKQVYETAQQNIDDVAMLAPALLLSAQVFPIWQGRGSKRSIHASWRMQAFALCWLRSANYQIWK